MRFLTLISLLFFSNFKTFAANDYFPIGARAIGLANTSVALTENWSIFNNIAGLGGVKNTQVGMFYEQKYRFSDFNLAAISFNCPVQKAQKNWGKMGFGIAHFGNQLYKEIRANMGWANKIRFVSLGFQLEYLQTTIETIGSKSNLACNLGGQAEISKNLTFGACIFNINQAKISENESIPTLMKAGISYHYLTKIVLNAEIEKEIEKRNLYKLGLEYAIIERIIVRTGINLQPEIYFFGFGWQSKIFDFNYAFILHPVLGDSHAFSMNFNLFRKKNG
jgi:hypothetical protein